MWLLSNIKLCSSLNPSKKSTVLFLLEIKINSKKKKEIGVVVWGGGGGELRTYVRLLLLRSNSLQWYLKTLMTELRSFVPINSQAKVNRPNEGKVNTRNHNRAQHYTTLHNTTQHLPDSSTGK